MTDPVRRVHYFFGQLLTVEDLLAEQDYHREMRYLHNRLLGQGVAQGLEVSVRDGLTVVVGAGLAIDACGREIVLTEDLPLDASDPAEPDGARDLTATWAQEPDSFVVPVEEGSDEAPFTRWLERPSLALVPPGQAPIESVVLGRVLLTAGEVSAIDLCSRSTWQPADPGRTEPTAN